jgi:hypothetical protein
MAKRKLKKLKPGCRRVRKNGKLRIVCSKRSRAKTSKVTRVRKLRGLRGLGSAGACPCASGLRGVGATEEPWSFYEQRDSAFGPRRKRRVWHVEEGGTKRTPKSRAEYDRAVLNLLSQERKQRMGAGSGRGMMGARDPKKPRVFDKWTVRPRR